MTTINKLKDALEDWVLDNANGAAEDMLKEARARTPVNTGRAKAGWEVIESKRIGESAYVANDVDYIVYLEDGTSRMAPNNMAKAAMDKVSRK